MGSDTAKRRWAPVAALCALALVAGVLVTQALDSDQPPSADLAQDADQDEPAESAGSGSEGDGQANAEPDTSDVSPATGKELNDEGFALLNQGNPEAAIPKLEQAVEAFPEGTSDLNYAYALYNLGNAYLQAGRPEEAIPFLEERLEFPDQRETVLATLAEARAAAADD